MPSWALVRAAQGAGPPRRPRSVRRTSSGLSTLSSEAVARERRWVALALLWEWIGAQTVSDGWEPAWAAALTGSGRSRDDAARECPDPTPDPPPKRQTPKGCPRIMPSPQGASSPPPTTILTTMERWLKEIEGGPDEAIADATRPRCPGVRPNSAAKLYRPQGGSTRRR